MLDILQCFSQKIVNATQQEIGKFFGGVITLQLFTPLEINQKARQDPALSKTSLTLTTFKTKLLKLSTLC